jgi:hypothetical protein
MADLFILKFLAVAGQCGFMPFTVLLKSLQAVLPLAQLIPDPADLLAVASHILLLYLYCFLEP